MNSKTVLLRKLLRQLRKELPPLWAVRVRHVYLKKFRGDCNMFFHRGRKPYFYIRLLPGQTAQQLKDTLAHEWAHAMTWGTEALPDHSAEWGVAYARCYTLLLDEPFDRKPSDSPVSD